MKLLILGGTRFLGRALVDAALDAGHEVTLFNRGQTNPELFPSLEKLTGDRDGGLDSLRGRLWDAAIDTCGYVPRLVGDSVRLLADQVDHYSFISSVSVYADPVLPGSDEDAPLAAMEDEDIEEVTGETYGPLKVLCEQAATEGMNGRALLVRAGLLVGPHDQTDRFTFWPVRVAAGGDILAPGSGDDVTQFIDVRDIAAWTVAATEKRLSGPYNVTGPEQPLTIKTVLHGCRDVTASKSAFHWASESFLAANDVEGWSDLPLWVPQDQAGFLQVSVARAMAAGLAFRPLEETIRDTLVWASGRPADYELRTGLSPGREAELLQRLWSSKDSP